MFSCRGRAPHGHFPVRLESSLNFAERRDSKCTTPTSSGRCLHSKDK
jgi:hypothetical protein